MKNIPQGKKQKKVSLKKVFNFFVYAFALAGFILISVFFAVRLGLTNVSGIIDSNNLFFEKNNTQAAELNESSPNAEVKGDFDVSSVDREIERLQKVKNLRSESYCKLKILKSYYPSNVKKILSVSEVTKSDPIVAKMISASELGISGNHELKNILGNCSGYPSGNVDYASLKENLADSGKGDVYYWVGKPEWQAIKEATEKDRDQIEKVSKETGIESRLIVSNMIVEQLRLANSQREVFKQFFEPLKVLCSANKISLGVMGIKEATAKDIENHLKDPSSPYYLGDEYEHLLDFTSSDVTSERYNRLVDDKNHYYSYLYGALYLKQMMKQWSDAGYDITYRPEIVGTLFNVGFPQSHPNPSPKVGGSSIKINDREYSFGSLAYEFYYSGELLEKFPYEIK